MTIQKKKLNLRLSKCCGSPLIPVWDLKKSETKPVGYVCECCKKNNMNKGFALIEFMVAIVIIGILAGMIFVSMKGAKDANIQKIYCEQQRNFKYINGQCISDNQAKCEAIGGTWFDYFNGNSQCVK